MKKFALTGLALTCIITLAGCSTSRGGNNVDSSKYLTEKPKTNNVANINNNSSENDSKASAKNNETNSSSQVVNTNTTISQNNAEKSPKPSVSESEKLTKPDAKATDDKTVSEQKPTATTQAQTKDSKENLAEKENMVSAQTNTESNKQNESLKIDNTIEITNPLKEMQFQAPKNNGILTGATLTLNPNGTTSTASILNVRDEKLNELNIEGATIHLFNTKDLINGIEGNFKPLSNNDLDKNSKVSGVISGFVGGFGTEVSYDPRTFRNMRFGVYNVDNINTLFVQGIATPTNEITTIRDGQVYPMPTTAKAIYKEGHALYGKDGKYVALEAEVVADFDQKTISVDLKEVNSNTKKLSFEGKIDGNTFSGSTNGIESKGAFYGSRAAEVGGIFYQTEGSEKGHNGVFGATDKRGFR